MIGLLVLASAGLCLGIAIAASVSYFRAVAGGRRQYLHVVASSLGLVLLEAGVLFGRGLIVLGNLVLVAALVGVIGRFRR